MKPLWIFLLAALILAVWSSTEAEGGEPTLEYVGNYDTDGDAWGVTISGNYAYCGYGYRGLAILNIEDPANPTFVGSYDTDGHAKEVFISGNYAYVADYEEGLIILDIASSDAGDDDEILPSVSMIPALISIGLIAIFRRK